MTEQTPTPAGRTLPARTVPRARRGKPAHTAKIITAGLTTTAVLGMTAVIGWQARAHQAEAAAPGPVVLDPATQAAIDAAAQRAVTALLPPVSPVGPAAVPMAIPAVSTEVPGAVARNPHGLPPVAPVVAAPAPAVIAPTPAPVPVVVAVVVSPPPAPAPAPAPANATTSASAP